MEVNVLMKMLRCVIGWREKMIEGEEKIEERKKEKRESRINFVSLIRRKRSGKRSTTIEKSWRWKRIRVGFVLS